VRPVDEAELESVAAALEQAGVEAAAVCFINAYLNSAHEDQVAARLRQRLPSLSVTTSSELVPEIREYARTSTTLANVYVQKIAEEYLLRLQRRLAEIGVAGRLLIMQSNGGLCEAEIAARFPVRLVESGPAAGAIAAAYFGGLLGHRDLLSFDMGGTTAKACVILDGEPLIAAQFEVDRRYHFKKGSGLPIRIPVVEMIEIGTGGGSIARVDSLKRLRVGPQSAGSPPGPACYGLGGSEPTVTDADLVLGYLDPGFFLVGRMRLDRAAAETAIAGHVGTPLGLDVRQAAAAIHRMANESMASAARIHAVERACDVERLPIFAFGGAGPVHAYGVARILGSPSVIYPPSAGVMSAIGFLVAPVSFDLVRSMPGALASLDWAAVQGLVGQMEAEGARLVRSSGNAAAVSFRRFADMRYQKQGFEIRVPLPDGPLGASAEGAIRARFETVYRQIYGHHVPDAAVECVSWRVIASGAVPTLRPAVLAPAKGSLRDALKGERTIYLPDTNGFAPVPVYDRYKLPRGARFEGPAIIEEIESTVVIGGKARLETDEFGNLRAVLKAD
jgi:N-methylhydantoinase A